MLVMFNGGGETEKVFVGKPGMIAAYQLKEGEVRAAVLAGQFGVALLPTIVVPLAEKMRGVPEARLPTAAVKRDESL